MKPIFLLNFIDSFFLNYNIRIALCLLPWGLGQSPNYYG